MRVESELKVPLFFAYIGKEWCRRIGYSLISNILALTKDDSYQIEAKIIP